MKPKNHYKTGLTLIEIVVVIGILTFIMSFGLFMDLSYLKSDTLRAEENTIVSALEKARSRALNNIYQAPHGFCYIAPNYVIFRDGPGTRCVAGVSTNELIPANINIASNTNTTFPATVIFSQLAGTTTGSSIHLTDGVKSVDITINYEGTIIW